MKRPASKCPKCDEEFGFYHSYPVYREFWPSFGIKEEYLEWSCKSCGYVLRTPTADKEQKGAIKNEV